MCLTSESYWSCCSKTGCTVWTSMKLAKMLHISLNRASIHVLKQSTFTFSVLWWVQYVRGERLWATVMIRGPRRLKAPHIGSSHDGWGDQLNNMKCVLLVTCSLGIYWMREGGRTGGVEGHFSPFSSFSRLSFASRHSGDWERINNGAIDKDTDLFTCL